MNCVMCHSETNEYFGDLHNICGNCDEQGVTAPVFEPEGEEILF